ncbi:MAG TPA: hypothetical protein V6D02_07755 [Candidatus Obscuribacterales bacterium]
MIGQSPDPNTTILARVEPGAIAPPQPPRRYPQGPRPQRALS